MRIFQHNFFGDFLSNEFEGKSAKEYSKENPRRIFERKFPFRENRQEYCFYCLEWRPDLQFRQKEPASTDSRNKVWMKSNPITHLQEQIYLIKFCKYGYAEPYKKSIDGGSFWHLSNLKWKAVSSRILSHLYSYIFFPMGLRILCRNYLRWFLLMELFHSNLVLQNFVKQICSCKSVIGFLFIQILFRENCSQK